MKKVRLKVTHEPVYIDIEVNDETDTSDEIMEFNRDEIEDMIPTMFYLSRCKIEIIGEWGMNTLGKYIGERKTINGMDYYFENYLVMKVDERVFFFPFDKKAGQYQDVGYSGSLEYGLRSEFNEWLNVIT